jgi:CheY-like chemotaxis protein
VRQKGLELAWLIHHDVPSLLSGDPGRLRQILINLTHLALRSTEKGEVLIHVTLEGESKTQATVHFAVMDTSRGIPKGRRSALFQFSPRLDSAGMRKWGTLEIGLTISRKLVEMMGGQIGVESRKGQGSTFWFTAVLRKQKTEKKGPWITIENIEGQPILIVDERSTSRQILREQLRAWGCLPEEAVGVKEAWAKLRQAGEKKVPYSLVILNKEMKESDGITLGRHIKEDPELSSTILVLLTSQGNRGDGKLVQEIGFAAYLTKPVMSSQLHDCLALAIGRRALPPDFTGAPLITRYSLEEEKKRRIRILLAEDDLKIQKVGLQILEKIGYRADVVANGKEVLSALGRSPYDLILMDVEMPVMDGFHTTAAIRQKEKNTGRHIPIIGMTARAAEGDREQCLEVGMDDYIPKPIQAIDVVDALDRFLSEANPQKIA